MVKKSVKAVAKTERQSLALLENLPTAGISAADIIGINGARAQVRQIMLRFTHVSFQLFQERLELKLYLNFTSKI
jgi:hypothetical protein